MLTQHLSANSIACIGEVMIELIDHGNCEATIGVAGDTYNTAVYLVKLLKETSKSVSYVTALGTDRFSARISQTMQSHGLDDQLIERRTQHLPGLYAINTDANGERHFSYWRGQSAARTLFQAPCSISPKVLESFDIVYLSGISMAILTRDAREDVIEYLQEFQSRGGLVAFDSNYRPHLWENTKTAQHITETMWSLCDIALPSLDDEIALFGDTTEAEVVARLQGLGADFGALKRAALGPLRLDGQDGGVEFSRVRDVVDTTAAGDSFNAGFLASLMLDEGIDQALSCGHHLAAEVIQKPGAIVEVSMTG